MRTAPPIATACGLTKAQISRMAEGIAERLNFRPGGDLASYVGRLGGKIEVRDTLAEDPTRSGSLFVEREGNFTIVVPAHTSSARDNFTIAHELGHYFLHFMYLRRVGQISNDSMMAYRKGSVREEWEANWFAASFLMPIEPFREAYIRFNGSLAKLSEYFKVSQAAADIRVKALDGL